MSKSPFFTFSSFTFRYAAGKDVPNPILKQETVKTLFKPLLTEAGAAALAWIVSTWDPSGSVNWSTAFALTTKDVPGKRRANSGFCTSTDPFFFE